MLYSYILILAMFKPLPGRLRGLGLWLGACLGWDSSVSALQSDSGFGG